MRKKNQWKTLLIVAIIISGIFVFTACTKDVENETVTIKFQDKEYTGQYTGTVDSGVPNGKGTFEYKEGDEYLSYKGTFKEGEFSDEGTLKTSFLAVNFIDLEEPRIGTYDGDTVSGIPEGKGTFTAVNDDKEKYTYTGSWKNGLWHGQGKQEFADAAYIGNYEGGVFKPSISELITSWGTNKNLKFTPSDKAMSFMEEHENLFPAKKLSLAEKYTNSKTLYKYVNKNSENYGGKLMKLGHYQVIQIYEYEESEYTMTEIIAQDSNYSNVIYIAYPGKKKNVYENDNITVYGLPLSTTSWENVGGGTTNAIALAGSYIIKE